MTTSAKAHIDEQSYTSWRQRSELEKMADLPQGLEKELDSLDQSFWISSDKLKEIVNHFKEELDEGLGKHGANVPMHVTWVRDLPTGNETGTILTIDLGGTNLRVCQVTLRGDGNSELDQEQYALPEDLKTGGANDLWDFIAGKVGDFIRDRSLENEYNKKKPMPLGFTFSYPASQAHIDHAVLQTWTKGFDIDGVEGKDVAERLRKKLEDNDLPVELICVINDTVGAMIASAYNDPDTIIGAIFGTGCNAAYMASLKDIKKLLDDHPDMASDDTKNNGAKMAINCEYGAFDNAHRVLPRTKYDKQIDEESPRPGEQTFEKLSAGLYLGEIFRLVLVDLADRKLMFAEQDTSKLRETYSIDTSLLSQIEDDESSGFKDTRAAFQSVLSFKPTDVEIEFSRRVAELIAVRGARLCACGVAAICMKEGIKKGNVAADGSVANKHPKFKRRWAKAMGEILDWKDGDNGEDPIKITSSEDGSGVGCAIIAAMELAKREKK